MFFDFLKPSRSVKKIPHTTFCFEKDFPLVFHRVNGRSKSLKLRFDGRLKKFIITTPPKTPYPKIYQFLIKNQGWMDLQFKKYENELTNFLNFQNYNAFSNENTLVFLGRTYKILFDPFRKKGVWMINDHLYIGNNTSTQEIYQKITEWMKENMLKFLEAHVLLLAATMGSKVYQIKVRDTKSRWGSCTSSGHLSFSWRLGLAPLPIIHYVIAHEVAHLKEMNHSKAFWNVVAQLCPDYKISYRWLKKNGNSLFLFDESFFNFIKS